MNMEKEEYYDRLFLECSQQEKQTDISDPPLLKSFLNKLILHYYFKSTLCATKEVEEARKPAWQSKLEKI